MFPVPEEFRSRPKDHPHSDTNCKFKGVPPKTPSGLTIPEELTGLAESCYTHGRGLLQGKDTDGNQPGEEMHGAESRNIPNTQLPDVLSGGSWTALTPPGNHV